MRSKMVLAAVLVALLLPVMFCALFTVPVAGTPGTIEVPGEYSKIQDAIDAANPGDTVLVASETYHEHLYINKSITLRGAGSRTTFINGDGKKNKTIVRIDASNVEVTGFTIENGSDKEGYSGIQVTFNVSATIRNNVIRKSYNGIFLSMSNSCNIINNTITQNYYGIRLSWSCSNHFIGNNIANNNIGIWLTNPASRDNVLYHNNFIGNIENQVYDFGKWTVWDNGYPSGGNYWSDYVGVDKFGGVLQDETGSDGIGDIPYPYPDEWLKWDKYPLMGPIRIFNACIWDEVTYQVDVVSNSTLSDFYFNRDQRLIGFNVTGLNGADGFCRVTIPLQLLWVENQPWAVLINNTPTVPAIREDHDYTYLYFIYSSDPSNVKIIGTNAVPEFPVELLLPLFMLATLIVIVFVKTKHSLV